MRRLNGIKMNMKTNCFGIHLTFGSENVDRLIGKFVASKKKGYACAVDLNVITNSFNNKKYREILNNASFNTCDGSFLAFLHNIKNNVEVKSYNGPEIFEKYISNKGIRQMLIGPRVEDFEKLKLKLGNSSHLHNLPLPFCTVDEFDYYTISRKINYLKPQIIWILLGAPKQEKFMNKILPLVNSGLLFGVGAALSFYLGSFNNRKIIIFGLRFIWAERILKEPKKQIFRILYALLNLHKVIKYA